MTERTIPILACRHLDDVLPFYESLGFVVTHRQSRPNPRRDEVAAIEVLEAGLVRLGDASAVERVPERDAVATDLAAAATTQAHLRP